MVSLVAASAGDWMLRAVGPLVGALVVFFARKVGRNIDTIATNVQSIPGIRTDVQALQTDVKAMNQRMEGSREDINHRLDAVQGQLDDRILIAEPVQTIARLMEQRVSAGPPRRVDDPPGTNHLPERTP